RTRRPHPVEPRKHPIDGLICDGLGAHASTPAICSRMTVSSISKGTSELCVVRSKILTSCSSANASGGDAQLSSWTAVRSGRGLVFVNGIDTLDLSVSRCPTLSAACPVVCEVSQSTAELSAEGAG